MTTSKNVRMAKCNGFFSGVFASGAILALTFLTSISTASAETFTIRGEHSQLRVFLRQLEVKKGDSLEVGLHFKMDPEWHIYWKNPGDSGAAPRFTVEGAEVQDWQWPIPHRLPIPPLTNYGYDNEVVFPIHLLPSTDAKELKFDFEWLVCKIECVPVFGEIKFKIPWGDENKNIARQSADEKLWAKYSSQVPDPGHDIEIESVKRQVDVFEVTLVGAALSAAKNIEVYPELASFFETAAPTLTPISSEKLKLAIPVSKIFDDSQKEVPVTFVLETENAREAKSMIMKLPKPGVVAAGTTEPSSEGLWQTLLFAFLGGLILNLMPCVLPVLSLKIMGFVRSPDVKKQRLSGWLYTAGVLTSFLALGLLLTQLRAAGEALGWGFQLQSPLFIWSLLVLFTLMALHFIGFYEWGDGLMNKAGELGQKSWLSSSFGTGVLAVFVASPCTAPFMGTAIGATLAMPMHLSLLVFLSLGLGLAFPMLLLGYAPGLFKRMPKPGNWMNRLKEFMAFPLVGTMIWLLWVLVIQKGPHALIPTLSSLLVLSFALWWIKNIQTRWIKILVVIWTMAIMGWSAQNLNATPAPAANSAQIETTWQAFTPELVKENLGKRPIFIDYTASWCITCQVNKLNVLRTASTSDLFKKNNVLLLTADWTSRDPVITKSLAEFKRNSVPLYVFYGAAGGQAQVLPELLTDAMIESLFKP